jgi:UDP-3-O-[3-hydroxymyristoyl] glucosamine N-acyltransferase
MEFNIGVETIREILPEAEWLGEGPACLTGLAGLEQAVAGDMSFLSRRRYAHLLEETGASLVFVPEDFAPPASEGRWFVRVKHPSLALAIVCERIESVLRPRPEPGIHPSAVVDPAAEIDPTAVIGPACVIQAGAKIGARTVLEAQVFVGRGASIGEDSWLYPLVAVHRRVNVGARCILHSGVVLGADGFGFEPTPQGHFKIPQLGGVEIGDDVEIGANSTIDRGRLDPTVVGQGTKIDNLVQLGHGVEVGKHCFLCSQVGISGSTKVGDQVVMAGQAGIAGHIEIGEGAQIGAQSGVAKSVAARTLVTGTPAAEFQKQRRLEALVRRLPQLFERVKILEQTSVD